MSDPKNVGLAALVERLRHDGNLDDEVDLLGMDFRYLTDVADAIVELRTSLMGAATAAGETDLRIMYGASRVCVVDEDTGMD
jgi:hypothetical protein